MTWQSHKPCPYEDCGSTDAFSYNTDTMAGHCHSCERKYPRGKGVKFDWAEEEYPTWNGEWHQETIRKAEPVKTYAQKNTVGSYMTGRGITSKTREFFNCKTYVSSDTGRPTHEEYIYPSGGSKVRYFPKDFAAKNFRGDELFGMNLWNSGVSKTVTITEGELDAMSVHQILYNPKYQNPVVSLPSSTPNKRLWSNVNDWLKGFDKIILSIDNDEHGDKIASKIAKMYPNKVYQVKHDRFKDANEFLMAGEAEAYRSAWFNAKPYRPNNILSTTQDFLDLVQNDENHVYVKTGLPEFDEMALGLMQGHFTVFKAATGIGKTEFMRYLEYRILSEYPDIKIAVWHMEEQKVRSMLGLCSYYLNRNVTRKDLIEQQGCQEKVKEAITSMTKDERLIQFFLNESDNPLDILDQIRYLKEACGVNYVFFEPIQDVAAGHSTDEGKEEFLANLATRLSLLAAELGVGIVTIGHTNDNGEVKYCRMIAQRASVVVDLERDKFADCEYERNTTKLLLSKNRPTGSTGYAGQLLFDPDTFTLKGQTFDF